MDWIEKINEHALRADFAVFIDVDPKMVMHRLKPTRSVMENLETQQKVREIYLKFVERGDLVRIDGNKSQSEVAAKLFAVVLKFLKASR